MRQTRTGPVCCSVLANFLLPAYADAGGVDLEHVNELERALLVQLGHRLAIQTREIVELERRLVFLKRPLMCKFGGGAVVPPSPPVSPVHLQHQKTAEEVFAGLAVHWTPQLLGREGK